MELVQLSSNPYDQNFLQPTKLLENYDSLIWTERYWEAGDFELISSDVASTIDLLPLESYLSLRDSTVPMIVDSHKIEKPKGKGPRIIVKGRSFESVLERRASVFTLTPQDVENPQNTMPPRGPQVLNADAFKQSDIAYKTMRIVLGDVARGPEADPYLAAIDPVRPEDHIPEINLPLPTDYTTGTTTPYDVEAGNLYRVVLKLLESNHHGIRSVRPPASSGKMTVDLEIYNGADLRESAVFDARFDQFDSGAYLLSYQGSTNVAYIYGHNGASVRQKNAGAEPSGLNRRVLLLDEMNEAALNSNAIRENRGLVELYKNNAIALFDGEITESVTRYNKPVDEGGYGLGDIVTFRGDYGLTRPMRVAEFIRTSDSSGEKAYPTFQAVDED